MRSSSDFKLSVGELSLQRRKSYKRTSDVAFVAVDQSALDVISAFRDLDQELRWPHCLEAAG